MTRPLRIEYPGAWYHVMNRGSGKQAVFNDPKSHQMFLDLLSEAHDRFQIQIHAYCLMDNHYHLLVHTPLANLGKAMKHIDGVYTIRYNRLIGRDGSLFRGRYKAILVEAENYLLELSRYIHVNPVTACMVKNPEDYLWSSYKYYLLEDNKPPWLYCDEILSRFSVNQIEEYKNFVIKDDVDKEVVILSKQIPILGSENFIKKIKEERISSYCIREVTGYANLLKKFMPTMEEVIDMTAIFYKISPLNILKNEDIVTKQLPRKIAIYLSFQLTNHSQRAIAEKFGGLTYSAISQICKRIESAVKVNNKLLDEINVIKTSLSNVKV